MRQKIKLSNGILVEIGNKPFASGGEADIYEVLSPTSYSGLVLKIYKVNKRTKQKEDKIKFLIGNKPNLTPLNGHHSVIWPIHLAYMSEKFIGYTMPKASGIKLELLCHRKLPENLPKEWEKFSFNTPRSTEARLKLCYNISAALSQIHSFGCYVLVDMKPDNVIVKSNGLISIIDIDSTEIINNNKLLFPAHVATPEYIPPEYYKSIPDFGKDVINQTWDRFSIAIIFYRLLLGIHPFTASLKSPYENLTNVSDIIQKGFLPVGKSGGKFRIIPPPHFNFNKLETQIQHLFINALEESTNNPNIRPTTDEWCRLLCPNPGIQLNRQLPSEKISYFIPVYSKPIPLISIPKVTITKPVYLKVKNNKGFIEKLIHIFIKSEKEVLYQNILSIQHKVNYEQNKLKNLKKQYLFEKEKSKDEIKSLIKIEKENIDRLFDVYMLRVKQIDDMAKELFLKEAGLLYNSYEKNYVGGLNDKWSEDIETNIRRLEKYLIDKIENASNSKLQTIELKRMKEQYFSDTKLAFDTQHDELIKNLRTLNKEFSIESKMIRQNTKTKMDEIKNNLKLTFDNITTGIKENIVSYNNNVNLLVIRQNKYNQIKF